MHSVSVEFLRFDDISFGDVLKGVGVYVIWSDQARAKPTYIGKGDILSRLSQHDDRFASVDGYVGIIGGKERRGDDDDSYIVEALLLETATRTDRWPQSNSKDGHWTKVHRAFRLHGLVRVAVRGCDPFAPPSAPRRLAKPKYIRCHIGEDGEREIQPDWNLRKLLRSRKDAFNFWNLFK